MIDFRALEAAQLAHDAMARVVTMSAIRVAEELTVALEAGGHVAVRYSKRDGHITPDQARELLVALLDGLPADVRADAESALGMARKVEP